MPRLSHLTRPRIIDLPIDLGDGDRITIRFDANKVTSFWLYQVQQLADDLDALAIGRGLTEVITDWDVTDDQEQTLPVTAENLSMLTLSAQRTLVEKLVEASAPGAAEGNASATTSSTAATDSTPPQATHPNGLAPSTLQPLSASPSQT